MTISTDKAEWCVCWVNKKDPRWCYEVYADGKQRCKHCGKKIQYYFQPRVQGTL